MGFRKLALAGAMLAVSAGAGGAQEELLRQGERQLGEGRIAEALATLQRAVEQDPGSSLAFTRLGGAQVLDQQYAAGIDSFKRAIALDAENADAFIGMAIAYIHSARYSLARAALMEARELDPAKEGDIDKLIAWLDQRAGGSE